MTPKNKKVLIILGVITLVVLIYLWWKNNNAAAVTQTVTTPSTSATTTPTTGTVPITSGTPAVTSIGNPVTGQTSQAYTASNGAVDVPSTITQWAQSLPPNNQAQFFKMLPSMSGSEISSLNDIIINAWGKGANPSAAQTAFWNTWRTKYHILDGTVNNFTGKPGKNQYGKTVRKTQRR